MMLHKIFHMNQSVEETKRRLANVSAYRHHLDGVEQADFSHGISHWKLALPLGFRAQFTLNEAVSPDGAVAMFKSAGGDFQVAGAVTFTSIKKNLTEVEVTVNYESSSVLFNLLDRMLKVGDHFLVSQLRRVRAHFEGIAAPVRRPVTVYGGSLKPMAA